jgi:hypothetical protein
MLGVALLLSTHAMAQDVGDTAWTTEKVDSSRFVGEPTPGPVYDAETKVTVLAVEGDKVRVFAGTRFGWVAASQLTTTPPADAAVTPPAGMPVLPPPRITQPPTLGEGL